MAPVKREMNASSATAPPATLGCFRRLLHDNPEGAGELFAETVRSLEAPLARNWGANVDDMVSDAWIRAVHQGALARAPARTPLAPWVRRLILNLAREASRTDRNPESPRRAARRALAHAVECFGDRLTHAQRSVARPWAKGEHLPAIADKLGIGVNTAKERLGRARNRLARLMTETAPLVGRAQLPGVSMEVLVGISARWRRAYALYKSGRTYSEMGDELECTAAAARAVVQRLRRHLQRDLAQAKRG